MTTSTIRLFTAVSLLVTASAANAQGLFSLYFAPAVLICTYGDPAQCEKAPVIIDLELKMNGSTSEIEYDETVSRGTGRGYGLRSSIGGTISRQLGGIGVAVYGELSSRRYQFQQVEEQMYGDSLAALSHIDIGLQYCIMANLLLSPCLDGGFLLGATSYDAGNGRKSEFAGGYTFGTAVRLNIHENVQLIGRARLLTSRDVFGGYFYESSFEAGISIPVYRRSREGIHSRHSN